jgi:hypothetical protein
MRRFLLATLCLCPLFLTACDGPGARPDPASFVGAYMYHSNANRGHYDVRISPSGELTVQIQLGTGEIQRAAGQLTPEQTAALFNAFKGWHKLSDLYPGDWTNLIQITYDDYKVEVHDPLQAPKTFVTVNGLLDDYAGRAIQAATRAASQPATQTAPAATQR